MQEDRRQQESSFYNSLFCDKIKQTHLPCIKDPFTGPCRVSLKQHVEECELCVFLWQLLLYHIIKTNDEVK